MLHILQQQRINPPTAQFVERFGHRYGQGGKVIHIVDDRERDIYNGVTRIDHAQTELTAMSGQTEAIFDLGELDALQLAYATTIHKSEGSSTQCVVMPLTMQA